MRDYLGVLRDAVEGAIKAKMFEKAAKAEAALIAVENSILIQSREISELKTEIERIKREGFK